MPSRLAPCQLVQLAVALPSTVDEPATRSVFRDFAIDPAASFESVCQFYGLPLQVDARVLDPRPDTETLVEWALACLPESAPETRSPRILDLGTGSGAVALALQHARPDATVWAVDASEDALAVARANAARLQLGVQFIASDWLNAVDVQHTGRFDLIVSNPPYVAEGDPHLAALTHEPLQALTSGPDGLDVGLCGLGSLTEGIGGRNRLLSHCCLHLCRATQAACPCAMLCHFARCTGSSLPDDDSIFRYAILRTAI